MSAERLALLDALRRAIGAVVRGDVDGARYWIRKAHEAEFDAPVGDGQEILL